MVEQKENKTAPKAAAKKANASPKPVAKPAASAAKPSSSGLLAVVRIRGVTGINPKRQMTLELLGIGKSHCATLIQATPITMGMLRQAKDYITWGPATSDVVAHLLAKRGEMLEGGKVNAAKKPEEIKAMASQLLSGATLKSLGVSRIFRLTPPSGGFKNRKKNYPYGDLGARPSMDGVLKNMI